MDYLDLNLERQNNTFVRLNINYWHPMHQDFIKTTRISRQLKQGRIHLDREFNQIRVEGKAALSIPYSEVKPSDWGNVYEKYVGQVLEDEGYSVTYRGLDLGMNDRGIDLIAQNDNETLFIQCKYQVGRITKNKMEWILYKASQVLLDYRSKYAHKITFMLIVNNLEANFSRRVPKGFQLNGVSSSKSEYPILAYFLSHNHTQDKVKLDFREIEMIR